MGTVVNLTAKKQFLEMFEDNNKSFLRMMFDKSIKLETARAAIEVTREKGYTALADEMEHDLSV